jgi:glycosyltransferase involved in cell wall biosynthesis
MINTTLSEDPNMSQVSLSCAEGSSYEISDPLVTAVIPTRNRPELVTRAVRSALEQTYQRMEVVVVIDGPDAATESVFAQIQDERLRVIRLPQPVGGSGARNVGVQAARGEWIGLLDDDDEWLPTKIERQARIALCSRFRCPVVASKFVIREAHGDFLMPRRSPSPGEHTSDYLFTRKRITGTGRFATPVIFCKRSLLLLMPFRCDLQRHQDTDWYLRVFGIPGVGLEFIDDTLAIVHMDHSSPRISPQRDWVYSMQWLRSVKKLVTPRAYAGFIANNVADEAAGQCDWSAFPVLLREMLKVGKPGLTELGLYFWKWAFPSSFRRVVREHLSGTVPK